MMGDDNESFERFRLTVRPELQVEWDRVLRSGAEAQQIVEGGVMVGGTASALYAGHRLSSNTDHLLPDLRNRFEEVLEALTEADGWRTARLQRPVLILGSLHDVEVGFRQMRRSAPVQTSEVITPFGPLRVPTLDELIGMKAILAYRRSQTRDYIDLAALSVVRGEQGAVDALMQLDRLYPEEQTHSIRLEIAKALIEPLPLDLEQHDLSSYKGLAMEWWEWSRVHMVISALGEALGERIVLEES